jgi:hypothetical protein
MHPFAAAPIAVSRCPFEVCMVTGVGTTFPLAAEMTLSAPTELKLCEFGCGRSFWRPISLSAKLGQKVCKLCQAMSMQQRERQFAHQRSTEIRARLGRM